MTTGCYWQGHGKLVPAAGDISDVEVEFKIRMDVWMEVVRAGLPPARKGHAVVELMEARDGRVIPEGLYQLQFDKERAQLQNLGFGQWELLAAA